MNGVASKWHGAKFCFSVSLQVYNFRTVVLTHAASRDNKIIVEKFHFCDPTLQLLVD